jgi:hypothetical protein
VKNVFGFPLRGDKQWEALAIKIKYDDHKSNGDLTPLLFPMLLESA